MVLFQEDAEAVVESRLDDLPRSGWTRCGPQAHADEPGAEQPEERASVAHRLSIQGAARRSGAGRGRGLPGGPRDGVLGLQEAAGAERTARASGTPRSPTAAAR